MSRRVSTLKKYSEERKCSLYCCSLRRDMKNILVPLDDGGTTTVFVYLDARFPNYSILKLTKISLDSVPLHGNNLPCAYGLLLYVCHLSPFTAVTKRRLLKKTPPYSTPYRSTWLPGTPRTNEGMPRCPTGRPTGKQAAGHHHQVEHAALLL